MSYCFQGVTATRLINIPLLRVFQAIIQKRNNTLLRVDIAKYGKKNREQRESY